MFFLTKMGLVKTRSAGPASGGQGDFRTLPKSRPAGYAPPVGCLGERKIALLRYRTEGAHFYKCHISRKRGVFDPPKRGPFQWENSEKWRFCVSRPFSAPRGPFFTIFGTFCQNCVLAIFMFHDRFLGLYF